MSEKGTGGKERRREGREGIPALPYTPSHYVLDKGLVELTANVDLQFAEICEIGRWKLHDDISVRRHGRGTPQVSRRDTGVVGIQVF